MKQRVCSQGSKHQTIAPQQKKQGYTPYLNITLLIVVKIPAGAIPVAMALEKSVSIFDESR